MAKINTSTWDKNPVPAIRAFLGWVKSIPGDERYDYTDPFTCPNARFHKTLGLRYNTTGTIISLVRKFQRPASWGWAEIVECLADTKTPDRTYGSLATATRVWLRKRSEQKRK